MRTVLVEARIVVALSILTVLVGASPAMSQANGWSRYETALFAGVFDVANSQPPIEAGLEVRRSTSVERLALMGGITATEDQSAWIYGGARYDVAAGPKWIVAPGFAVAFYEQGDGKDLGQTLEFRSSIEVGRQISEQLGIGLVFYHLSNASLSDHNPGANSLVLNFAFRHRRR